MEIGQRYGLERKVGGQSGGHMAGQSNIFHSPLSNSYLVVNNIMGIGPISNLWIRKAILAEDQFIKKISNVTPIHLVIDLCVSVLIIKVKK